MRNDHLPPALLLAALLLPGAPVGATPVRVEMTMTVFRHEVGTGLGFAQLVDDAAFVPFTTPLVLTFDADVRETWLYDQGHLGVYFDGDIRFESVLSGLVPWSPASLPAAELERDLAYFDTYPEIQQTYVGWQRFYDWFPGNLADNRYFAALYTNHDGDAPYVDASGGFGTAELLDYLELLRARQWELIYQEDAWFYDGNTGLTLDRDKYHAAATIDSITVVPLPAAAPLLATGVGVLVLARRRIRGR